MLDSGTETIEASSPTEVLPPFQKKETPRTEGGGPKIEVAVESTVREGREKDPIRSIKLTGPTKKLDITITRIKEELTAVGYIKNLDDKRKTPGETARLYELTHEQLVSLARSLHEDIRYVFSTKVPSMEAFARTKGVEIFGWSTTPKIYGEGTREFSAVVPCALPGNDQKTESAK